jgi:hypothetical protein
MGKDAIILDFQLHVRIGLAAYRPRQLLLS